MKKSIKTFFKIGLSSIAKLSSENKAGLLKLFFLSFEEKSTYFWGFRSYPKLATKYNTRMDELSSLAKVAVVLQGPITTKDDFTLETVRIYRKYYPDMPLIISTWDDTNEGLVTQLRNLGVEVVLSKRPEKSGLGNMNFQLVSSQKGILKAKALGCQYVLKSRSDQRLTKMNAIPYLLSLLANFQPKNNCLNQRIITHGSSCPGSMLFPYYISDFFFFGNIDDMVNLFSITLSNVSNQDFDWRKKDTFGATTRYEFMKKTAPEIEIFRKFIVEKLGLDFQETVGGYWQFVTDNLITLSTDDIGLLWPKYDESRDESNFNPLISRENKGINQSQYSWDFMNWLSLYSGQYEVTKEVEDYRLFEKI
ncbi:MAG: WavE lipopolysaccharide synthesis family protein [Enterococcus sp.]